MMYIFKKDEKIIAKSRNFNKATEKMLSYVNKNYGLKKYIDFLNKIANGTEEEINNTLESFGIEFFEE